MGFAIRFLIASAFAVFAVQGQAFSKHDENVLKSISTSLKGDVDENCLSVLTSSIVVQIKSDKDVDILCQSVEAAKTTLTTGCGTSEYNQIHKVVCSKVGASNDARTKKVAAYGKVYETLSDTCQHKAGPGTNLKTWYDIEMLCQSVETAEKGAYKTACPKHYSDLKEVVCGGASGILSGLVTIVLCMVASLFNKL